MALRGCFISSVYLYMQQMFDMPKWQASMSSIHSTTDLQSCFRSPQGPTLSCSKRVSRYSCIDSGLLKSGLSRWSRYLNKAKLLLLQQHDAKEHWWCCLVAKSLKTSCCKYTTGSRQAGWQGAHLLRLARWFLSMSHSRLNSVVRLYVRQNWNALAAVIAYSASSLALFLRMSRTVL